MRDFINFMRKYPNLTDLINLAICIVFFIGILTIISWIDKDTMAKIAVYGTFMGASLWLLIKRGFRAFILPIIFAGIVVIIGEVIQLFFGNGFNAQSAAFLWFIYGWIITLFSLCGNSKDIWEAGAGVAIMIGVVNILVVIEMMR